MKTSPWHQSEPPEGVNPLVFRLLMWKRYFDTGYNLTSYIKYAVALFGLSSLNVSATLVIAFVYGVACFIIGYLWFAFKFVEVDNEISNRFNLFTREMREMKKKVAPDSPDDR